MTKDSTIDSATDEPALVPGRSGRSVSLPVSTILTGAALIAAVVATAVLGGLWLTARGDLADHERTADEYQQAEKTATDYAVGAATVNFEDMAGWVTRLKHGTSTQLTSKFDTTAPKLEEIVTPLRWTSTATPIAAKVASVNGSIYEVDVFVNVTSTNIQNPQGAQSTVTYNITLDRNDDWKITDVGGANAALPIK